MIGVGLEPGFTDEAGLEGDGITRGVESGAPGEEWIMRVRVRGAVLALAPVLALAMVVLVDSAKRWH